MATRAKVLERIEGRLKSAELSLKKFQDRFSENPVNAFEWGAENAMTAAVELEVYGLIKKELIDRKNDPVEDISREIQRIVLRDACFVGRSTEFCSNYMDRAKLKVYARSIEPLSGVFVD